MKVLTHGPAFWCGDVVLRRHDGPHEVRRLGIDGAAHYRYAPASETAPEVLARIAADWPPDLLLCWFPEEHPPPLGIEDVPVLTAALVGDWDLHCPALAVNLSRFDVVLCDKPGVEVLRSDAVAPECPLPLYSHRSDVHRPYSGPKDIDVAFIGTINPARHVERARILERVALLSHRHRVLITEGPSGEAYGRLLSRARIVVNHAARGELNARTLETLACGALAFVEQGNQEVWDWFTDGDEVVAYDEGNLEDRLAHFLERPQEADAIAARGHARAASFAGERRLTALIDWVAGRPRGGRAFRGLPPGEKDYHALLLYRRKGDPGHAAAERAILERVTQQTPSDPRFWTALGNHCVQSPNANGEDWNRAALDAYDRARELDPASAPYALNAATAREQAGDMAAAAQAYQAVFRAESLAGAELLLELHSDPFWVRWQRMLAFDAASLDVLQAHTHARLAQVVCAHEPTPRTLVQAEDHLRRAAELDPANHEGDRLRAELQWAAGRDTEAVDTLRDAVTFAPLDLAVRERMRAMLADLGRHDEAQALAGEIARITRATREAPP